MIDTATLYETARDIEKDYARGIITRDDRSAAIAVLEADWRPWLASENGVSHLSQETQDAIFRFAWEEGHSSGYSEVENYYVDVAVIALIASR